MVDLFNEINDDIRADRANELWRTYGKWVIYGAISVVIVTAMVVFGKDYERGRAMEQTAVYFAATDLLAKGEASAAASMLNEIRVDDNSPYYSLVLLKKAEAYQMAGNGEEAQKNLAKLASRKDAYGEIGKILLQDGVDDKASRGAVLTDLRNEWRAWEMAEKGETLKAAEAFGQLALSETAPASQRERALMMANYLKNKAGKKPAEGA